MKIHDVVDGWAWKILFFKCEVYDAWEKPTWRSVWEAVIDTVVRICNNLKGVMRKDALVKHDVPTWIQLVHYKTYI